MRLRKAKRSPKRVVLPGAGVLAGLGVVGAAIVLLRKHRRRLKGAVLDATAKLRHRGREYDDVTLAHKVESEIFRDADAPKGDVVVNAQNGIIQLRGQVDSAVLGGKLARAAAHVEGVKDVQNLLHAPGTKPPAVPVSDPEDVKHRLRGE